eukprot:GHVH01016108.1.p1 GENE.GHVH01016108.1~~GHVH01016108.1.p1  ORF type:complete len:129 (+),score=20.52 GHVH01016108.1:29-388(+)
MDYYETENVPQRLARRAKIVWKYLNDLRDLPRLFKLAWVNMQSDMNDNWFDFSLLWFGVVFLTFLMMWSVYNLVVGCCFDEPEYDYVAPNRFNPLGLQTDKGVVRKATEKEIAQKKKNQ